MERRIFMGRSAAAAGLLLEFAVAGGASLWLTPAEARDRGVAPRALSAAQARTLEDLAEAIVPGAARAGVAAFVDQQLGADPDHAMLIAKYFQVPPPYLPFYGAGLDAAQRAARAAHGRDFDALRPRQRLDVVARMAKPGAMDGEYPLFLFYMCLRSDAVDVVYGTPAGFARLNTPYMAHIEPPGGWHGERV